MSHDHGSPLRAGARHQRALTITFGLIGITQYEAHELVGERRNALVSVVLAALVSLGSFYLINSVLRVPLPVGPWGL